jgi:hypothetical protein
MIGQGVLEARLHHRLAKTAVCPSMMHDDASLRTTPLGSTAGIGMTSATSLKIGGVSGSEHHPHRDDLW